MFRISRRGFLHSLLVFPFLKLLDTNINITETYSNLHLDKESQFYSKISRGPVNIISSRSMRIPLEIK